MMMSLATFGGCTLDSQKAPDLAGPSSLALSFDLTASPDVLMRDGVSTSTIEVTARDANGAPVNGVTMYIAGQLNLGTLSASTGTTNSAGKVSFIFTSPGFGNDTTTTLTITPVGSNHQNGLGRTVAIRLLRP